MANAWEAAPVLTGDGGGNLWQSAPLVTQEVTPDRTRGAPASVRALVGNAKSPEDRLANLRRFYPDAQPHGDDNFTFTDPETGQPTLYNPPGMDYGDVASVGREVVQGFGGAVGGIVGAAAAAPTGMTTAGLTIPVGAALGSQIAGQGYDLAQQFLGGAIDSRSLLERSTGAAGEITAEAALGKAGAAIPSALRSAVGGMRNRLAGASGQQLLTDYARAGIPITGAAGAVTGSTPVQGTVNALAKLPSSSTIMENAADATMEGIKRYADDVGRGYGVAGTVETAGRGLQKGGRSFVDAFKTKAGDLYAQLGQHIAPDEPVVLIRTAGALKGPLDAFTNAENIGRSLVPGKFQGFLDDIAKNQGALTWEQVKAFRSYVGDMASDPRLVSDIPTAQWKQLYGALSDDMAMMARAKGPQALAAFNRANSYYRAGSKRIEEAIEPLLKSPQAADAWREALSGAKAGGQRLWQVRRSMPADVWGDFVATKLDDMGRATPGAQGAGGDDFSVSTFLTNYNRLAPEAKAALFRGGRFTGMEQSLDRLVRIVGSAKDVQRMTNTSGTAQQNVYMQIVSGSLPMGGAVAGGMLTGGPVGAVAGAAVPIVLPRATAKLMTNPDFVKWLANGATIAPTNYNSLGAHLGRLTALAKANPEIREEIYQFAQAIRDAPASQNPPGGTTTPAPAGR